TTVCHSKIHTIRQIYQCTSYQVLLVNSSYLTRLTEVIKHFISLLSCPTSISQEAIRYFVSHLLQYHDRYLRGKSLTKHPARIKCYQLYCLVSLYNQLTKRVSS